MGGWGGALGHRVVLPRAIYSSGRSRHCGVYRTSVVVDVEDVVFDIGSVNEGKEQMNRLRGEKVKEVEAIVASEDERSTLDMRKRLLAHIARQLRGSKGVDGPGFSGWRGA